MPILIAILGAIVGSFLNVCIERLPRNQSLIAPRSHCQACHASIKWRDLMPVLSYTWLKGRCHYCAARIPFHHLLVEVMTPIIFLTANGDFTPLLGCGIGAAMLWLPGCVAKAINGKTSMGAGDIKLAGVLGLYFGWQDVLLILWLACFIGAIYGIIGIRLQRLNRQSKIPLGFFIGLVSVGYLIASCWLNAGW